MCVGYNDPGYVMEVKWLATEFRFPVRLLPFATAFSETTLSMVFRRD
jgi:hypothetical protein